MIFGILIFFLGVGLIVAGLTLLKIKNWAAGINDWAEKKKIELGLVWGRIALVALGVIMIFSVVYPNRDTLLQRAEVKPEDLVTRVVNTLEKVRHRLDKDRISFEGAELSLAVTNTSENSGEGKFSVVTAGLSVESEDAITVTYKLNDWLRKARKQTFVLHVDSVAKTLSDARLKTLADSLKVRGWRPTRSDTSLRNGLKRTSEQIKKSRQAVPDNDPLSRAIRRAIDDYVKMKEDFGEVCFEVEIAFEVTATSKTEIEVEVVEEFAGISGAISRSLGNKHSITFSFGNCN